MSSLSDFQDLVNSIRDEDLLVVAEGLLKDIIEIQDMKERIEKLEDGLSEGKRAAFWFFAMGLDREQIDLATNAVIGRKRILVDQAKKQNAGSPNLDKPTSKESPLSI
jgi:hypothetical protein